VLVGRATQLLPRSLLYRIATSDRVETTVRARARLERRCYALARRYVAGIALEDALAVVAHLRGQGMTASVDLFGEGLSDANAIERVVRQYIEAARRLRELDCDAYLEVVPSHLGLDLSQDFLRERLERIIEALPSGSRLEISAEESWRTERILGTVLALARAGGPVVATLPANLRRSAVDAERLTEAAVPVRLVKGAYIESPDVSHPWGDPTDLAFIHLAHTLHAADRRADDRNPRPGDSRGAPRLTQRDRRGDASRRPSRRRPRPCATRALRTDLRPVRRGVVSLLDATAGGGGRHLSCPTRQTCSCIRGGCSTPDWLAFTVELDESEQRLRAA
jgi:proline dehydrogenase